MASIWARGVLRRGPRKSIDPSLSGAGTIDAACMRMDQRAGRDARPFGTHHGVGGQWWPGRHARAKNDTKGGSSLFSTRPCESASGAETIRCGWMADPLRIIRLTGRLAARGARKRTGASRAHGSPPPRRQLRCAAESDTRACTLYSALAMRALCPPAPDGRWASETWHRTRSTVHPAAA